MGWSDYTTEDKTALTSTYNFMQCLTLAYNERAEFAGISQLAEVKHLVTKPVNFCQSFDGYLDSLIPHFGKIIDGAYVAYTVKSIYEELAETRLDSRLPAYKLNPIYYRLWFEQVIRVINKLILYFPVINISYNGTVNNPWQNYSASSAQDAVDKCLAWYIDGLGPQTPQINSYNNSIKHYTAAGGPRNPEQLDNYYADAISTNVSVQITVPDKFKNSTEIFSVFINATPPIIGGVAESNRTFNSGTSLLSQGNQCLFGDIEVEIDNNAKFDLPLIPGEDLDNFPKYPTPIDPYERFLGYEIIFTAITIDGNFKFIAGS